MDREEALKYLALYIATGAVFFIPYHFLGIYLFQRGLLTSEEFTRLFYFMPYHNFNFFAPQVHVPEALIFLFSVLFLRAVWKKGEKKAVVGFFLLWLFPAGYLYYDLYRTVKAEKEKVEIRGVLKGLPLKVEGRDGDSSPISSQVVAAQNTQESLKVQGRQENYTLC